MGYEVPIVAGADWVTTFGSYMYFTPRVLVFNAFSIYIYIYIYIRRKELLDSTVPVLLYMFVSVLFSTSWSKNISTHIDRSI